jgi:hypothetical protein
MTRKGHSAVLLLFLGRPPTRSLRLQVRGMQGSTGAPAVGLGLGGPAGKATAAVAGSPRASEGRDSEGRRAGRR